MPEVEIDYQASIAPLVRGEIAKVLSSLTWLLPPWCQKLHVFYSDDGENKSLQEGAAIEAHCDYRYRNLSVTFYPCFLTHSASEQLEMCIHDLLHATTGILADYARDEIRRLIPEEESPKYRSAVLDELENRHEAMTQDLAYIIRRHLLPPTEEAPKVL